MSLMPTVAAGQSQTSPAGATAAADADPGKQEKPHIGPFLFDADIAVSGTYDDNIFSTRNFKESDFITVVSPALRLDSQWKKHELGFYAGADIGRYALNPGEDYEDFWFGADGGLDLSSNLRLFGGGSFTHEHENRNSPNEVDGTEPTTFDESFGYLGVSGQFDEFSTRIGGTFKQLDFEDVPSSGGRINNDDRDRQMLEIGSRFGYRFASGHEAFVQGAWDARTYQAGEDDAGFDRDSNGFSVGGGIKIQLDRRSEMELLAGYLDQDYEDPALDDIRTPDAGLRLTWWPFNRTKVTGRFDRGIAETTSPGASGYIESTAGMSIVQFIRPDLTVDAGLFYTNADYVGIDREDNSIDANLGVDFYLTPNVWIGTEFRHTERDSNVAGEDYDENQITLTVGAQLQPRYTDAELAAASANGDLAIGFPDGVYLGVQGGYGDLFTGLDGTRGAGGALVADFGDHGATGGGFLGYGLEVNRWHFGLELEAEMSEADWSHARLPGGRVFQVYKEETVGASARIGYRTRDNVLFYGRFGGVGTSFETHYDTAQRTSVQHDFIPGLRFGAGVEIPAVAGTFVRMDYTYTAYDDYDVPAGRGGRLADNFSNEESLTRIGFGYRFGAGAEGETDPTAEAVDRFSGFYAGGQFGYGGLHSFNQGPRQAGSTLTADRASQGGSGGAFGGYGHRFGDFYLGAEVDAGLSYANWNIEREPTGRVYSVEKRESFAAAARIGYVLNDLALIYARVGVAETNFHTDYQDEGGVNRVVQDDMLTGLRLGAGVEVPISEDVFARFDYSYTDYEDYAVDYVTGVDGFDTDESLMQFGVGYRF